MISRLIRLMFVAALAIGALAGIASAAPLTVEQQACRVAMKSHKPVSAKALKTCRQGAAILTLGCDNGKVYVIPAGRDYLVRIGKPAKLAPMGHGPEDLIKACEI